MKHLSFSRVAFLLALVVTVASCGMPLYSTDGYYEEAPVGRDVYRGSAYGSVPIVYERDPYTGRYYEVNPYSVYSRPARPYYDRRSNNRYHNNNRNYDNRYNNNNRYNNSNGNNTYRNNPQVQPQRTTQTAEDAQKQRDAARERILGKRAD